MSYRKINVNGTVVKISIKMYLLSTGLYEGSKIMAGIRNPHKQYDIKRPPQDYRCWYCTKQARRIAGGKPICGHANHYTAAVKEFLDRQKKK